MDVAILNGNALRIKGKNASLIIDPTKETGKIDANCVIKLNDNPNFSDSKVEDSRITISGPGEFEVGGIKISIINVNEKLIARLEVDLVKLLVGDGETMEKVQEKVEESDLLVVNSKNKFNYSSFTALNPKAILAYGENAIELEKALGKSNSEKVHKFSITAAKLPTEMQFIHLT